MIGTIERSRHTRAPKGHLTVPARIEHNGLLLVNGRVGRTRARVLVDTGAERSIGNLRLTGLSVTFGDQHVFNVWGRTEEPALLVGMDILGTVERLVVDDGRREFQLKPRGSQQPSVEICSTIGCGSRLPGSR